MSRFRVVILVGVLFIAALHYARADMLLLGVGGAGGGGGGGPVERLISRDDHSNQTYWSRSLIGSVNSGQGDKDGGTTAESIIENGTSGAHYIVEDSISATTGRVVLILYYKQVPGSASTRRVEIGFATAGSWTNGASVIADESGNIISSGPWGNWTTNSITVTSSTNGYYKATLDMQTTDANLLVWFQSNDDSGSSYLGDGVSGWYVDANSLLDY